MDTNPQSVHLQASSVAADTNNPSSNPVSNTGVNPATLQFGLGWLTLTFRKPSDVAAPAYAQHVSKLYEKLTKDFFVKDSYGFNSYQHSRRYASGSFLAFSDERDDLCLSLTQELLDRLTPLALAKTIYKLNTLQGVNITRLDVYFDDYARHISPAVVEAALQVGLHPSKSVQHKIIRAYTNGVLESDTIYVGSQHSEFYVRVYDKGLESQGKQNCTRLEFQLRGNTANTFFAELIYTPCADWGTRALLLLLSKFDFVHRSGPRNDKTTRRLDWWHKLVASASSIPWRVQRVRAKLLSTIAWAEDVLPTTLHMLSTVFGVDGLATWAANLMQRGASKMKLKHHAMMDAYLAHIRLCANG